MSSSNRIHVTITADTRRFALALRRTRILLELRLGEGRRRGHLRDQLLVEQYKLMVESRLMSDRWTPQP